MDAEERLQEAIKEATDKMKYRDIALKHACQQFSKTNLTVNAQKITKLADAFYNFIVEGKVDDKENNR
jgi:hypothetical protein